MPIESPSNKIHKMRLYANRITPCMHMHSSTFKFYLVTVNSIVIVHCLKLSFWPVISQKSTLMMATGGVGISDTYRQSGNPKHKALKKSHIILVSCIKQSPQTIVGRLIQLDVLSRDNRTELTDMNDRTAKATKIVDIITDRVEQEPSFFNTFISEVMEKEPWMERCLEKVNKNFEYARAKSSHNSNDNSDIESESSSYVSAVSTQPVGLYKHLNEAESDQTVIITKFSEVHLENMTIDIQRKFVSLETRVADALEKNGVTSRSLIFYLKGLEAVKSDKIKVKRACLYFDENFIRNVKRKCLDVYDVFEMIRDYYSWVNYGLLEDIIDTFLCENDAIQKKLRKYEDQYKKYCENRVCDIPRNGFMRLSKRRKGIEKVFKIDYKWDEIRMDRIETIRDRINTVLNFNSHTLGLKVLRNGCVEVTFEIPEHVADAVFPLTEDQVQILKQHSIKFLGELMYIKL